jgi:hypothetical protein
MMSLVTRTHKNNREGLDINAGLGDISLKQHEHKRLGENHRYTIHKFTKKEKLAEKLK